MSETANPSVRQYGIRWPTGAVFSYASREAAEDALREDDSDAGVLVVHDIEPGTPNATEWREVAGVALARMVAETYAAAVVRVLREHFPDLSAETSHLAVDAIARQGSAPAASFEFIVDDPFRANWRLKAKPGRDGRHVRLRCYRVNRRQSDNDLEDAVNDALRALED